MGEHCDTDAVVETMENIMTLKNLKRQIETGHTQLGVSVEAIDGEISRQRQEMENTIAACGSLEGVPEEALDELEVPVEAEVPEPDLTELNPEDLAEITEIGGI